MYHTKFNFNPPKIKEISIV